MMGEFWSDGDTRKLLAIWSEEGVQEELTSHRRGRTVFRDIADQLRAQNVDRTEVQVKCKIKNLKMEYNKLKSNGIINGRGRQSTKFFPELDRILAPRYTPIKLEPPDDGSALGVDTDLMSGSYPVTLHAAETHFFEPDGFNMYSQIEQAQAAAAAIRYPTDGSHSSSSQSQLQPKPESPPRGDIADNAVHNDNLDNDDNLEVHLSERDPDVTGVFARSVDHQRPMKRSAARFGLTSVGAKRSKQSIGFVNSTRNLDDIGDMEDQSEDVNSSCACRCNCANKRRLPDNMANMESAMTRVLEAFAGAQQEYTHMLVEFEARLARQEREEVQRRELAENARRERERKDAEERRQWEMERDERMEKARQEHEFRMMRMLMTGLQHPPTGYEQPSPTPAQAERVPEAPEASSPSDKSLVPSNI